MKESPKKFDLSIEQSTNLFKLALEANQNEKTQDKEKNRAELLLDTLASKLPINPALLESLPAVLRSLSEELQSVSGLSLGKLLQNSKTKTVLFRRIKDFGKDLGTSANDEIERDVALAIYYAAIAGALVFHNVKISEHTYKQLEKSFETLSKHVWIPPNLTGLYKKACNSCRKKI
jgi:adenylate kinase